MTRSFTGFTPSQRFDALPWTEVHVEEAVSPAGPWTLIDTITLSPVDADPAHPAERDFTTTADTLATGWYRITFYDAAALADLASAPMRAGAAVAELDAPYFTVAELRAQDAKLADGTKFPDALLEENRQDAEAAIEHACSTAFVPRETSEEAFPSCSTAGLVVSRRRVREVVSVLDRSTGTFIDSANATVGGRGSCTLYLDAGWPSATPGGVLVTYTHGHDEPPRRVKRAALILTKNWVLRGPVDDRATQLTDGQGATVNLATPGVFGAEFGLPEVDAVVSTYRETNWWGT